MIDEQDRIDLLDTTNGLTGFIDGPGEFLVKHMAQSVRDVPEFADLFGVLTDGNDEERLGFIDSYKRMDYGIRNLPALRIYSDYYNREFESWFVDGEVTMDVIYPPLIRREQTQQYQDTISAALLQQFSRPVVFQSLLALIPGLNELGRSFSVQKGLGFEMGENVVPLTQIKLNFRIDLRRWREHLEQGDRTLNDPFERTIGDLRRIVTQVKSLQDDGQDEGSQVTIDQRV